MDGLAGYYFESGEKKGLQKGLKKGLKNGVRKGMLAAAERMIALGQFDNRQIALITQLSEEQINELRKKIAK